MNRANNKNNIPPAKDERMYSIHTLIYWNLGWVIVLLVIAVLSIMTLKLTNQDCSILIDSIENFATLLSIILSISSILFAYFTSQNTSRHFEEMSNVLVEVKEINNNIQSNNNQLLNMVHQMALNVKSIDVKTQFIDNLSNQITRNPMLNIGSNSNMLKEK